MNTLSTQTSRSSRGKEEDVLNKMYDEMLLTSLSALQCTYGRNCENVEENSKCEDLVSSVVCLCIFYLRC